MSSFQDESSKNSRSYALTEDTTRGATKGDTPATRPTSPPPSGKPSNKASRYNPRMKTWDEHDFYTSQSDGNKVMHIVKAIYDNKLTLQQSYTVVLELMLKGTIE